MIVSMLMYKTRKTKVSNILKILFNLGQIIHTSGSWGFYITPAVATYTQCAALQYYTIVGNTLTRVSLSAFLLWRLRQINLKKDKIDKFTSATLLIAKVIISVSLK